MHELTAKNPPDASPIAPAMLPYDDPSTLSGRSIRPKRSTIVLLAVLLALTAGSLRLFRASADGLTFDEQWQVEIAGAKGSIHENVPLNEFIPQIPNVTTLNGAPAAIHIWNHLDHVTHPPLYFVTLRWWMDLLHNDSDLAAKSWSVTLGVLSVVMLFDAVFVSSDSVGIAFFAALIAALAPAQIFLSQQVRSYSMLQFLGCGLIAAVLRIEKRGTTRWRVLAVFVCSTCLALTHYFAIFPVIAVGIYALVQLRGRARRDVLIAMVFSAATFAIAWGPFMFGQRHEVANTADTWLTEPPATHTAAAVKLFERMTSAVTWQIFAPPIAGAEWGRDPSTTVILEKAAIVFGALVLLPMLFLWRPRPELRIWFVWICGTLLFVTALDAARGTRQLLFARYTALALPAICAIIALIFARAKSALIRFSPAFVVAIATFATSLGAYNSANRAEPEWSPLGHAAALELSAGTAEPVIFYSGQNRPIWYTRILYLGTSHYAPELFPRPAVLLTEPATAALVASLPGQTALLISGSPPYAESVDAILPGTTMVDQIALPNLATLTRVQLPPRATSK